MDGIEHSRRGAEGSQSFLVWIFGKFILGRGDCGVIRDCRDKNLCEPSAPLREFYVEGWMSCGGGAVGWY